MNGSRDSAVSSSFSGNLARSGASFGFGLGVFEIKGVADHIKAGNISSAPYPARYDPSKLGPTFVPHQLLGTLQRPATTAGVYAALMPREDRRTSYIARGRRFTRRPGKRILTGSALLDDLVIALRMIHADNAPASSFYFLFFFCA